MPSEICNLRAGRLCAAGAGLRCPPRGRRDRSRVLAARTRRGGRIQPGERVLDLGAGTGRFASLLHASNPIVALDSSREMLAIAHATAPFACVRADGHRLPLRADTMDVTVIVMVLQHLHNYELVLREVARVSHRFVIATTDL